MVSPTTVRRVGIAVVLVVLLEAALLLTRFAGFQGAGLLGNFSALEAAIFIFGPGAILGVVALVLWLRAPSGSRLILWWVAAFALLAIAAPFVPIVVFVQFMLRLGPT